MPSTSKPIRRYWPGSWPGQAWPGRISTVVASPASRLELLDPAAQLARRPQRVDQLQVVVGQQRRGEGADRLQRPRAQRVDVGLCSALGHRGARPCTASSENVCQPAFSCASAGTGPHGRHYRCARSASASWSPRRGRCSTSAACRTRRSRRSRSRSASRAASSTAASPPRRSSSCSRSPTTSPSSPSCSRRRSAELRRPARPARAAWPRPTPASASATRPSSTARWRSCSARRASSTRSSRSRSGCASARGWRAASASSPTSCARGVESGAFELEDPDYTANVLWTQTLGAMHLARIGVGVRRLAPGVPELFTVTPEQVVAQLRRQRNGDCRRFRQYDWTDRRLGLTSSSALSQRPGLPRGEGKGVACATQRATRRRRSDSPRRRRARRSLSSIWQRHVGATSAAPKRTIDAALPARRRTDAGRDRAPRR